MADNFRGYDISPDMVRLSLVNMYLHGFAAPHIFEYDTLTSEDRWNEYADVILANPPFMSPKGGIRPHNRFSVKSKRSEVLFVDYMAEHLTPAGRAGIIVPEGITFQSQNAYKQLRKMLVEDYLVAVVSLPAGVFNPYSGVKTSTLILDKALARKTDRIAFFKVENDGFDLGAQRRPIERNDLPRVQAELAEYLLRLRSGDPLDDFWPANGLVVEKSKVAKGGEYYLSVERYRGTSSGNSDFPMVPLGQVARLIRGITFRKSDQLERETKGSLPVVTTKAAQESGIVEEALYHIPRSLLKDDNKLLQSGDILISTANSLHLLGRTTHVQDINRSVSFGAFVSVIRPNSSVLDTYLVHCLRTEFAADFFLRNANTTTNISNLNLNSLAGFEIPLPPLEVQREIVAEIEGYQKVIDGARAVVENYRPHIVVDPEWPIVKLEDFCTIVRGSSPRPKGDSRYYGGSIPRLMVADITRDGMYSTPQIDYLTEAGASKSRPMNKGDVVITVSGNPGLPTILAVDACIHDGFVGLRELHRNVNGEFLYWNLLSQHESNGARSVGAVFKNLTTHQVKEFKIPLPSPDTQQAIVADLGSENALVAANRELICRFEYKVQEAIARVWGA